MTVLWVALGGAIGASLRYGVVSAAARVVPTFPVGTIAVNVVGSLLMGVIAAVLAARGSVSPFLMSGVLGGFTTFSAFSLDAVNLFDQGRIGEAALYVLVSVSLSIGALVAGLTIGRSLLT